MKTVTIAMDEHLLEATEDAAKQAGVSVSHYVSSALEKTLERPAKTATGSGEMSAQRKKIEAFLRGPNLNALLDEDGKAPSRDEANAR